MNLLQKAGGRKLILAFFLTIVGVLIELYSAKGLTTDLLSLFGIVYTGFAVGNVAETMSAHKKEALVLQASPSEGAERPSEAASSEVMDKLNTLETKIDAVTKSSELNNQANVQVIGFINSLKR